MDALPVFTQVMYSWRSSQKGLFLGLGGCCQQGAIAFSFLQVVFCWCAGGVDDAGRQRSASRQLPLLPRCWRPPTDFMLPLPCPAVSLAMVPVNATVGALSAHVSDRSMVFGSLALCTACLLALTASTASATVFFGGGVMLFVGSVVLEGTATSLMSKCIWRGFAQGVLNAGGALSPPPLPSCTNRRLTVGCLPIIRVKLVGFSIPQDHCRPRICTAGLLSTEAGTLGRFAGNALLAGVGKLTGLQDVAQLTDFSRLLNATLAALCVALLVLLGCTYSRLRG